MWTFLISEFHLELYYRSYKHFGCAINQIVLPKQRRFRIGSFGSSIRGRRSSLPASFLGKRHSQRVYIGLADGKIVTAVLSDIIDDMSSEWEDLKVRSAGPISKLIVEDNNGFTQGYALCGKNTVTQFSRVQEWVGKNVATEFLQENIKNESLKK